MAAVELVGVDFVVVVVWYKLVPVKREPNDRWLGRRWAGAQTGEPSCSAANEIVGETEEVHHCNKSPPLPY